MKDIHTFLDIIKQEWYIMTKKQKKWSICLFAIIVIGSLCELLGVTAILPFIQSLLNIDELKEKKYISFFINLFKIESDIQIIFCVAFGVMIVYLLKNLYLLWALQLQYKFRYSFQRELSTRVLSTYMKRPYEYFLNINSAQVLRSIEGDVIGVFGIYEYLFKILAEILNIGLISIFLIYTDWIMAIGVLIIISICFISITLIFRVLLKGVGEKQRNASMQAKKYAYQIVNGIKEINVKKKNDYFIQQYDQAYNEMCNMERKNSFLSGCPEKLIEMSCVIGLLVIVLLRIITGVDIQEFVSKLSVFAISAFRILPAISKLIGYINGIIYQRPALEAAYRQIIEVEQYEKEMAAYIRNMKAINSKQGELLIFNNEIQVKNICWHYPNSENMVIRNLSLTIKKGEAVGFIGSSGAGKTTLSDIILGLFKPISGGVYVDGIDIYSNAIAWSKLIGYVPQSVYLTDDTIRNNVAFGEDKDIIDDERIWKALEQAQLKEFVRNLPKGLDTIVGERGIRFSGGQRQRIAIARVLYTNCEIIVLDEATSALDNETEKAIMESIDALQKEKTLIIVAHRLSTLKNCDRVFEIADGKAKEVELQSGGNGINVYPKEK